MRKHQLEKEAILLKKKQDAAATATDIVASVLAGGAPSDIPYELIMKWCDNFSPDNKLGDGSFGEVYQGKFIDSNKRYHQVAVKRLLSSKFLLQQPNTGLSIEQIHKELLNNLKREVNTLSAFRHDNIIKLLGCSLPDPSPTVNAKDTMCLVLELGTLGGLHSHLREDINATLLTWKRRVTILARVATALNYLHSHHMSPCFHRDVKSANIVLTSDYQPKLIDCGLSKYIPEDPEQLAMSVVQSSIGQRYGTPLYMDPDYAVYGVYTAISDVYSFGIVIAEVLTGLLQGVNGIRYNHDTDVDELVPDNRLSDNPFPVECVQVLQALILNCLKSSKKRISSVATVMRQLLDLEKLHCIHTNEETLLVDKMHSMEEELQQFRLSKLARLPSVENARCFSCAIECCIDIGVLCSSNHFLCNVCFGSNVTNQLSSEYRVSFDFHRSNIVCKYCLPASNVFTRQQLVCHVSESLFNQYIQVSQQVIETKRMEAEAETNMCVVCLSCPKTHCFVPCGHVCVCTDCVKNTRNFNGKCPLCRAKFTTIIRPFA
jgi:serine/threonine protein kinase